MGAHKSGDKMENWEVRANLKGTCLFLRSSEGATNPPISVSKVSREHLQQSAAYEGFAMDKGGEFFPQYHKICLISRRKFPITGFERFMRKVVSRIQEEKFPQLAKSSHQKVF